MATADERTHAGSDLPPGSASESGRHHGRDTNSLAEVISIRSPRARRTGLLGSLITLAWELAFPRVQATSAGSTPRPPSSPALFPVSPTPVAAPDDAA